MTSAPGGGEFAPKLNVYYCLCILYACTLALNDPLYKDGGGGGEPCEKV